MSDSGAPRDDLAAAFDDAFACLRARVAAACAAQGDAPVGVALGIRAAFRFAAECPTAARLLTCDALAGGEEGQARYRRVVSHFAALLHAARASGSPGTGLPAVGEDAIVGGLALLVARRLGSGREDELPAVGSDAAQVVLAPWVGIERARRIAAEHC